MIEPSSAAGLGLAVAGTVKTMADTVLAFRDLVRGWRGAPREIEELAQRAETAQRSLEDLESVLGVTEACPHTRVAFLLDQPKQASLKQSFRKAVYKVKGCVEHLTAERAQYGYDTEAFKKRLKYLWRNKIIQGWTQELRDARSALESNKSTFNAKIYDHGQTQSSFRGLETSVHNYPLFGQSLTKLHVAAATGNMFEVRYLIAHEGGNVASMTTLGLTPLHCAALSIYGRCDVVEELIRSGALVDAQTYRNNTPLIFAATGGHSDSVRALLHSNASVHDENADGLDALNECLRNTRYSTIWTPQSQKDTVTRLLNRYAAVKQSHWNDLVQLSTTVMSMSLPSAFGTADQIYNNLHAILRKTQMIPVRASQTYPAGPSSDEWHSVTAGDYLWVNADDAVAIRDQQSGISVVARNRDGMEKKIYTTCLRFAQSNSTTTSPMPTMSMTLS